MVVWWRAWGELVARQLARRWQARRGPQEGAARPLDVAEPMPPQPGAAEPRAPAALCAGTEMDANAKSEAHGGVSQGAEGARGEGPPGRA
jgi:hypothetical protein